MDHTFATLTALLLASAPAAMAENQPPAWLFVQTASGFTANGTTLSVPYEREIFAFTDRPNRLHAYLNAHEFAYLWWDGDDTFTETPPNAVLTWVEGGEVREAEILLNAAEPHSNGTMISYDITVEAGGDLPAAGQFASLFVDSASGKHITPHDMLLETFDTCVEDPSSDDNVIIHNGTDFKIVTIKKMCSDFLKDNSDFKAEYERQLANRKEYQEYLDRKTCPDGSPRRPLCR